MGGFGDVIICVTFSCLAFCFLILRCTARRISVQRFFLDDILAVAALVLSFGQAGAVVVSWQNGMGEHLSDVSHERFVRFMQSVFAGNLLYFLGLVCIKCSICCQFLNFFRGTIYRRLAWAMLWLCVAYGFACTFSTIFACKPISYWWDRSLPGGKCISFKAWWYANGGICIATDFALCILPMPLLKTLQLPRKQKYSLMAVFAVGGFASIVGILRLQSITVAVSSNDVTYNNVDAAFWSSVELNTGIICACMPTTRPIIMKLFPRLLATTNPKGPNIAGVDDNNVLERRRTATTTMTEDSMTFQTIPETLKEDFVEIDLREISELEHQVWDSKDDTGVHHLA